MFPNSCKEALETPHFISTGAVIGTYQGHLVLGYEQAIRRGLLAMRDEVTSTADAKTSDRERDFLKSIEIVLDGLIMYARRLAEKVKGESEKETKPDRKAILSRVHDACSKVPLHPAVTFHEAVQSFWTVKAATEIANITNVHSAGRLDQVFYPYYQKDVSAGLIRHEEARELFEELLLKIMTHNMRPESNFIAELLAAIDSNFVGYQNIFRMIKAVEGKWGNGNPESDGLAREITSRLFDETYKHRSYKNGPFVPFVNSMTSHTYDGRISIATPDGRKAATPYAASCNPYNVDKCGITGVLRSVAALDFKHILGCAVNIRLHPTAIGLSEETRRKWIALIQTYFNLGGMQIQPTVASTEMLRAAQRNPEEYRSLIVKVGGYSTYFTDLGIEIQNEIIARSEHTS